MAEIDEIYNTRLFEIAAAIPHSGRLKDSQATASAYSKLCGSSITVDLSLDNGKFSEFAQTVKACLLGQAAAAIVGREIIGTTPEEFHTVAEQMRNMLKANGPPPSGRWQDLALLEPVRDYRARHTSTLLVFDAVEDAVAKIVAAKPGASVAEPGHGTSAGAAK